MEWALESSLLLACFAVLLTYATWTIYNTFFATPRGILKRLRAQGIPGCPFVPFVGQLPEGTQLRKKRDKEPSYAASTHGAEFFLQLHRRFGKLGTYCFGPHVRLLIIDPVMIKQAYVNNNDSFPKTKLLRSLTLLGDGLLTASGETWAGQRKLINPAFNHKEIKRIFPAMVRCTEQALSKLASRIESSPNEPINMAAEFSTLTLDTVCRSAFGSQLDARFGVNFLGEIVSNFHQYLFFRLRALHIEGILPFFKYIPTEANRKSWAAEKFLRKALDEIISARLEEYDSSSQQKEGESESEQQSDTTDLLELMMRSTQGIDMDGESRTDIDQSEKRLSVELLKANCLTFLLAGHETTANLLTWTCLLLSQHPDWQEKAREEVNTLYSKNGGGVPTFEQLNELKAVSWVLNEALRLYPPAPIINRTTSQDTKIGDIIVPAGCDIVVPIAAVHLSKEFWGEDADEFRPERFANGISKAGSHPNAFVPFSLGPRTCIGQNFALVEARIILAMFLRRFSWVVSPSYRHHPEVTLTLRAKHGLPVDLKVL